ncbi:MAG TPA: alpha/beta fold hydrolase [Actinomycetota bacterium]|nr:alpha/beta fold hydrolase [Actinomycetota bacterium]
MSEPPVRPGCEPFSLAGGPVGVLMVHGLTGSPASMRPIGEWLAGEGLSVEGVRLPGHGTNVEDLRTRRWTEWVDEAARGLGALRERCRSVVAFGQSGGASVVLALVASRPHEIDGIALTNPYVFDARLLAVPVGRRVLRDWKGIANDIAKPGQDEHGYERTPVAAIAELSELMRFVRSVLPEIRQPIVVFRSGTDHVIPRSNATKVLERIGSTRKQLVPCPNSFHVVTLDHDAPLVRERVLAFANELDGER